MDLNSFSRGFQFLKNPTEEMIFKRRRLSEQSNGSESTGERQLNESFKKMDIQANNSSQSCPSPTSEAKNIFKCPKPIRPIGTTLVKSEDWTQVKDNTINSILDQHGIQRYLTLDSVMKMNDIKFQHSLNEKKRPLNVAQQKPILFPFGQPANLEAIFGKTTIGKTVIENATVYLKEQMDQEDAKIKENLDRQRFMDSLSMARIPRLTNEERQQKVSQYLVKKHNRQWTAIRYKHRQSLADKRERVQGRFVKSQGPKFYTPDEEHLSHSWSSSTSDKKNQKGLFKHEESLRNSQQT